MHVPGLARCAANSILLLMSASPLFILGKSRMRRRARTDLCGGRSVMVVPTATPIYANFNSGETPLHARRDRNRARAFYEAIGTS